MPQYTPEEIEEVKKCFPLYVKFPKNRWKDIKKAEPDTVEGNKIFSELKQIFPTKKIRILSSDFLSKKKEAQELLPNIEIDYDLRIKISQVCGSLDVDGLRGDIVTNRAAKAYAAYNKQSKVTVTDIEKVITLCLRHRLRKDPLESIDGGSKVSLIFEEVFK